ncbi:MAG: hypothetical protein ACYDA8_14610, partial [Deferrisomatales bacterium]
APADLWGVFLAVIEAKSRPLWNVLKAHGALERWDAAEGLAVVVLDDPGHEFFLRPRVDALTDALRAVAGPAARLELRSEGGGRPNGTPRETDRARSAKREVMEHPFVREAVNLFEGDVEEVRVLKP